MVIFTTKCIVIFVNFCQSVISQFSKAYYSKGIHANVFKLCIPTNFEVVFLVIWSISEFGHFLTLVPSPRINFGMANNTMIL
jgi:hypothetical protein